MRTPPGSQRRALAGQRHGRDALGGRHPGARQRPLAAMTTLTVEYPKDLLQHVGRELGPSEWITVDQATIDRFAEATGDFQWIHVDVERARRELPGGRTIAHGYLTLSLVPLLLKSVLRHDGLSSSLNYGSNKVRYTAPVPPSLGRGRGRGRGGASPPAPRSRSKARPAPPASPRRSPCITGDLTN